MHGASLYSYRICCFRRSEYLMQQSAVISCDVLLRWPDIYKNKNKIESMPFAEKILPCRMQTLVHTTVLAFYISIKIYFATTILIPMHSHKSSLVVVSLMTLSPLQRASHIVSRWNIFPLLFFIFRLLRILNWITNIKRAATTKLYVKWKCTEKNLE